MKDDKFFNKPLHKETTEEKVTREETPALPIVRGSMVRFNGTKSYSGLDLSQYSGKEYRVKEISGDRIVIAEGANVVAAVNIKDCQKI